MGLSSRLRSILTATTGLVGSMFLVMSPAQAKDFALGQGCLDGRDPTTCVTTEGGNTQNGKKVARGAWSIDNPAKVGGFDPLVNAVYKAALVVDPSTKAVSAINGIHFTTTDGRTFHATRTQIKDHWRVTENPSPALLANSKKVNCNFSSDGAAGAPPAPMVDAAAGVMPPPPPPPPPAPDEVAAAPAPEFAPVVKTPPTSGLIVSIGGAFPDNTKGTKADTTGIIAGNLGVVGPISLTGDAIIARNGVTGKTGLREAVAGPRITIAADTVSLGVEAGLVGAGTTPITVATPQGVNPILAGQSDGEQIASDLGVRGTAAVQFSESTSASVTYTTTAPFGGSAEENDQKFNQVNVALAHDDGRFAAGVVVTPYLPITSRDDVYGVSSKAFGVAVGGQYGLDSTPNGLGVGITGAYGRTKTSIDIVNAQSTSKEIMVNPYVNYITQNGKLEFRAGPVYSRETTTTEIAGRAPIEYKKGGFGGMASVTMRLGNAVPVSRRAYTLSDAAADLSNRNDRYSGKTPRAQAAATFVKPEAASSVLNFDLKAFQTSPNNGAAPLAADQFADPALAGFKLTKK